MFLHVRSVSADSQSKVSADITLLQTPHLFHHNTFHNTGHISAGCQFPEQPAYFTQCPFPFETVKTRTRTVVITWRCLLDSGVQDLNSLRYIIVIIIASRGKNVCTLISVWSLTTSCQVVAKFRSISTQRGVYRDFNHFSQQTGYGPWLRWPRLGWWRGLHSALLAVQSVYDVLFVWLSDYIKCYR